MQEFRLTREEIINILKIDNELHLTKYIDIDDGLLEVSMNDVSIDEKHNLDNFHFKIYV